MTRKLITLSLLASSVALTVGCSSVPNETPNYGAVGSTPGYSTSGTYESVQYGYVRNIQQLETSLNSIPPDAA